MAFQQSSNFLWSSVSSDSVGLSAQARKEVKSRTSRTLMVEYLDWIIAWAAVMSIRFQWRVEQAPSAET